LNGAKSEYTYYTQNAHGDVVNLTDKDGAVVKSYTYDAFGVEQNIDDSDANAFRYCGEYYDAETGTVYLRARYYDPTIGRFISRDSFSGENEVPLSLNLYTYCHNNPIIYLDPSGHVAIVDDVLIFTFLVLAIAYVEISAYNANQSSYSDVCNSTYSLPNYNNPWALPYDDALDSPITFSVPDAVSIPRADSLTKSKERDSRQKKYYIYVLYDNTNTVQYVGQTTIQCSVPPIDARRAKEHKRSKNRGHLNFEWVTYNNGTSYMMFDTKLESRFAEQAGMEYFNTLNPVKRSTKTLQNPKLRQNNQRNEINLKNYSMLTLYNSVKPGLMSKFDNFSNYSKLKPRK